MSTYEEMAKEARDSGQVRNLSPIWRDWKKAGDTVIGVFKSRATVISQTNQKPFETYTFDTDGGLVRFLLGGVTDRDVGVLLMPDHLYQVTFEGQEKLQGGRKMNKFIVEEIITADESIGEPTEELPF